MEDTHKNQKKLIALRPIDFIIQGDP